MVALLCSGCGKKEDKKPSAGQAPAKTAEAPKAKTPPKPQPPKLKLELDKFVAARVVEQCALKNKESKLDARTVAIDQLAGRPYQAQGSVPKPPPAPAAPAAEAPKEEAAKEEVAKDKAAADKAAPPAKPQAAEAAKAKVAAPPPPPARTPGGRLPPSKADATVVANYEHDIKASAAWKPYQARIKQGVDACLWAPELGLVDEKLVSRYVSTFVEITCLQDKHRSKGGELDTVGHARAAVEVFERNGFTAADFARMGIPMGRFDSVQAKIQEARSKDCPDKRTNAQTQPANGDYIGDIKGSLKGKIKVKAEQGKLSGTIVLAPRGKRKEPLTLTVSGTKYGGRVHINASEGQDFLRLDCRVGGKACQWSGQVGFKDRKGTFTFRLPPPPPPEKSPAAVSAIAPPNDSAPAAPGAVPAAAPAQPAPKGPPTVAPKPVKEKAPPAAPAVAPTP